MDPDRLGFAAASLSGTLVMALGFWRQVDAFAIAIRAGLTAVVTYAATFFLVRCILHTALTEMVRRRRERAEKARKQQETPSEQG